jgi:hypothetical protein
LYHAVVAKQTIENFIGCGQIAGNECSIDSFLFHPKRNTKPTLILISSQEEDQTHNPVRRLILKIDMLITGICRIVLTLFCIFSSEEASKLPNFSA